MHSLSSSLLASAASFRADNSSSSAVPVPGPEKRLAGERFGFVGDTRGLSSRVRCDSSAEFAAFNLASADLSDAAAAASPACASILARRAAVHSARAVDARVSASFARDAVNKTRRQFNCPYEYKNKLTEVLALDT